MYIYRRIDGAGMEWKRRAPKSLKIEASSGYKVYHDVKPVLAERARGNSRKGGGTVEIVKCVVCVEFKLKNKNCFDAEGIVGKPVLL